MLRALKNDVLEISYFYFTTFRYCNSRSWKKSWAVIYLVYFEGNSPLRSFFSVLITKWEEKDRLEVCRVSEARRNIVPIFFSSPCASAGLRAKYPHVSFFWNNDMNNCTTRSGFGSVNRCEKMDCASVTLQNPNASQDSWADCTGLAVARNRSRLRLVYCWGGNF